MKQVSVYTIGTSHIKNKKPCQDYTAGFVYSKNKKCIVLCDGAGSCSYSQFAAEKFTATIGDYFSHGTKRKSDSKIKREIIRNIKEADVELQRKYNCNSKELYTTLLFVYVDKTTKRVVYGHTGDGVIAESKNSNFTVLSAPSNGEFSNATYFINSANAHKHTLVKTRYLSDDIGGYIIMSDGAEESLYNKKNKTMAQATNTMLGWLNEHGENDVKVAIEKALRNQLSTKTTDDISVSLLSVK